MIYVLIVVSVMNLSNIQVSMQEFKDVERCKVAASTVMKATEELISTSYAKNRMIAICMEK